MAVGLVAILVTLNTHITIAGLIAMGATLMTGPFLATRVSIKTPEGYIHRLGGALAFFGLLTGAVCYLVGDTPFASYTGVTFGAAAVVAGLVLVLIKGHVSSLKTAAPLPTGFH
jgi:hypothetical protein